MKILEQVKLDATLALKNGEKEKRIVLLTLRESNFFNTH